ncbi:uncharacterized protein LOC124355224 [Homalodisca vitripennis]|uniref:uncharacterized protein LOC124355224 n=1 Tax=Homalodisca vitripennis TaxID=197043 RepID=UPI001EEB5F4E|nr:uncharacterized protein LOC124355224 [Homalodisca vitripennis]
MAGSSEVLMLLEKHKHALGNELNCSNILPVLVKKGVFSSKDEELVTNDLIDRKGAGVGDKMEDLHYIDSDSKDTDEEALDGSRDELGSRSVGSATPASSPSSPLHNGLNSVEMFEEPVEEQVRNKPSIVVIRTCVWAVCDEDRATFATAPPSRPRDGAQRLFSAS